MLKSKICSLCAALIIAGVLPVHASAQISESEIIQYVPEQAFLLLSINLDTVKDKVDLNSEILKKFREREKFGATDFTEADQYLMLVTGGVATETEYEMPALMITRFAETIDPELYNQQLAEPGPGFSIKYEAESYNDHEIWLGSYETDDGTVVMGTTPAHFFPGDNMVAQATESVIKAVIDGHADDSKGQELAGNLDLDAELHLLIDDGENILKASFADMALGELTRLMGLPGDIDPRAMLESLQRLELIVDSTQMTPITATIEMKSEEAAEKVEELIQTGLQAAPALLMMGESAMDEAIEQETEQIEPVAQEAKRILALGKKAVSELQVERTGATIQIQLANIDGLEQFPQDVMTFAAHQQMSIERMMEQYSEMGALPMIEAAPAEVVEEDDGEKEADDDNDDDDGI